MFPRFYFAGQFLHLIEVTSSFANLVDYLRLYAKFNALNPRRIVFSPSVFYFLPQKAHFPQTVARPPSFFSHDILGFFSEQCFRRLGKREGDLGRKGFLWGKGLKSWGFSVDFSMQAFGSL